MVGHLYSFGYLYNYIEIKRKVDFNRQLVVLINAFDTNMHWEKFDVGSRSPAQAGNAIKKLATGYEYNNNLTFCYEEDISLEMQ